MTWENPEIEVKSGIVAQFYGTATDVPEGWVMCDGNNGTQDLRDKFVKSTSTTSELPGSTGGSHSISLSQSQMASHNHSITIDNAGNHDHSMGMKDGKESTLDFGDISDAGTDTTRTVSGGDHTHPDSDTSSTGSGNSIDNRPEHIELTYIQRL